MWRIWWRCYSNSSHLQPDILSATILIDMKINFHKESGKLLLLLDNGGAVHQLAHPETNEPITDENYLQVAECLVPASDWISYLKLKGVEFEGVMCSATVNDQNGLIAVLTAKQLQGEAFQPTEFQFENESKLVLSSENLDEFISVWMPFRQSFFAVSNE